MLLRYRDVNMCFFFLFFLFIVYTVSYFLLSENSETRVLNFRNQIVIYEYADEYKNNSECERISNASTYRRYLFVKHESLKCRNTMRRNYLFCRRVFFRLHKRLYLGNIKATIKREKYRIFHRQQLVRRVIFRPLYCTRYFIE